MAYTLVKQSSLDYRINSAKFAFAEHRGMLVNKKITLRTRITFLNGFVRSRLGLHMGAMHGDQHKQNFRNWMQLKQISTKHDMEWI